MTKTAAFLLVAALVLPSAALAKEPTAATIEGPGLDRPLTISSPLRHAGHSQLDRLAAASGVAAAMFGHRTPDPMSRVRPEGRLGPRYAITYAVPGPDGRLYRLVQDAYPYATPHPLTYMAPGQSFFETFRTHGGWYIGGSGLKKVLREIGLPGEPPVEGGGAGPHTWLIALLAAAGAICIATIAASTLRRRRRSPAPA